LDINEFECPLGVLSVPMYGVLQHIAFCQ